MGQDFQRLARHLLRHQELPDALPLRNNVGGKQAGQAVHLLEQELEGPLPVGKNQAGEGMDADRNAGKSRRRHAQQSGLGGHGMHSPRAFPAEQQEQAPQAFQILPQGNGPFHLQLHGFHAFAAADARMLRSGGSHGKNVKKPVQVIQLALEQQVQRDRGRRNPDELPFHAL